MNSPQLGLRIASVIAGFGAVVHLLRLLAATEVKLGVYEIALWPSAVAAVFLGALSIWFWRLASSIKNPHPNS